MSNRESTISWVFYKSMKNTKKKALYFQVLLACAMAETDDFGYFAPVDVREPMRHVMHNPKYAIEMFARHLHMFCEDNRGPILMKSGDKYRSRFRFENPLMQPFVLMKGLAAGM